MLESRLKLGTLHLTTTLSTYTFLRINLAVNQAQHLWCKGMLSAPWQIPALVPYSTPLFFTLFPTPSTKSWHTDSPRSQPPKDLCFCHVNQVFSSALNSLAPSPLIAPLPGERKRSSFCYLVTYTLWLRNYKLNHKFCRSVHYLWFWVHVLCPSPPLPYLKLSHFRL